MQATSKLNTIEGFNSIPSLKSLVLLNPEQFRTIDATFLRSSVVTNDFLFANVTNIQRYAFMRCQKIKHVGFPRA